MRWKLFATLAEAAGERTVEVTVDADDPTVRDALDALLSDRPDLATDVLDDTGDLHDHVNLFLDGTDPFADAEGWETAVAPDSELVLFPPASGG